MCNNKETNALDLQRWWRASERASLTWTALSTTRHHHGTLREFSDVGIYTSAELYKFIGVSKVFEMRCNFVLCKQWLWIIYDCFRIILNREVFIHIFFQLTNENVGLFTMKIVVIISELNICYDGIKMGSKVVLWYF